MRFCVVKSNESIVCIYNKEKYTGDYIFYIDSIISNLIRKKKAKFPLCKYYFKSLKEIEKEYNITIDFINSLLEEFKIEMDKKYIKKV